MQSLWLQDCGYRTSRFMDFQSCLVTPWVGQSALLD
jgi:hypothetical protein